MDSSDDTRVMLNYSTLDLAEKHLDSARTWATAMLFLPLPLIAGAVCGFFVFHPPWYKDVFLWSILLLFVCGQVGALVQMFVLKGGTAKAAATLEILRYKGDRPDLNEMQVEITKEAPPCHLRDSILRWIQLGIQGETRGLERMMEHAAVRRDQAAKKILSFHSVINRTTLKLGFLGTLIGLLMTFDPMKRAMLSLQGSEGEFKFIHDIVKAIDGDAYAILTTLFATGLSVFIELLTIQAFDRILGQFEMVNNNLDDWCLIHLEPWIKQNYSEKKTRDETLALQEQFSKKLAAVQRVMDQQLRALAVNVKETGRQVTSLGPLQQEVAAKVKQLSDYEKQYRQLLNAKLQSLAPTAPPPPAAAPAPRPPARPKDE